MAGETIITVVGNITSDPELRYTQNGLAVANFTIASTPRTFDRQANEWKDGDATKELDRQLKLSEAVMRTKVLRAEEGIAQVAAYAKAQAEKAAKKAAAAAKAPAKKDD